MMSQQSGDIYDRTWIIEHATPIVQSYSGTQITLRQLYYRLVAMHAFPNDIQHYKRVVAAMGKARWDSVVDFDAFIDREREMIGATEMNEKDVDTAIQEAKDAIQAWMEHYRLERWSNQPEYVEVWVEKKALLGTLETPCRRYRVGLGPCKGYSSLTFLNEAKTRFQAALDVGKELHILYFGDYDPSGKDIPRSLKVNIARMGIDVEVHLIALNLSQITAMKLPSAPPKLGDSRTKNWKGGGVVELDAVEPKALAKMCEDVIRKHFDKDLYDELLEQEETERQKYQKELKDFVSSL